MVKNNAIFGELTNSIHLRIGSGSLQEQLHCKCHKRYSDQRDLERLI